MSLDIGDLVGYIKLDHSGVGNGVRAAQAEMRQGMSRIAADAGQQGRKAGQEAGTGLSKGFKNATSDLRNQVARAFAVGAAVAGLAKLKDAASDLNETTSMSGVIFGRNAKAMQEWAGNAPRTLGLAREEALRLSAGFADMFLQIGFAESKSMDMSKSVLQLAADLGSFRNLETADVLERISAGFRGEYDSLQLLVPTINAAKVEQQALAATGKANADALTDQEKAAAVLAIVTRDTARAQGDFARTADGAANAEKTAAAQTKDLAAQLGQTLLPAWIAIVTFGRDQVIPFLSATVDRFGEVKDAAGPVADGLGDVVGAFRGLPPEVQAATVSLIAFLALRGRLEAFGTGLQTRLGAGATAAGSALDTLRLHMMMAGDAAATSQTRIGGYAKAIGYTAGQGLRGAASGLLGLLGGPWGVAFAGAAAAVAFWADKHAEAKAQVESLTRAIEADSGALGKNTRESLANALEKSGAAKAAQELGINLRTLTNAALGIPSAVDTVNDRIQAMRDGLAASGADAGAAGIQYADLGEAMETVQDAVGGANAQVREAQAAAERHAQMVGDDAEATGELAAAQDDLGAATKPTTGSIKDQAKAAEDAAKAARDAAKAILEMADAELAASGAQIGYQEALAAVEERLAKRKELEEELRKAETTEDRTRIKKELEEYAITLDITTEAGRENRKVLNDIAAAARDKAEADVAAGASLKDVRKTMQDSREDFIENARRLGASKVEAEKMATQFGLTKRDVDLLAKSVEDLPASKQITIEAETAAAAKRVQTLKAQLDGLQSKSVVVTVQGRFVTGDVRTGGGRSTAGGQVMGGGAAPQLRYDGNGRLVAQANGGIHPAGMYSPADGVQYMFNEPETGGESFIPHAIAKRPRSTAILAETAAMFGYNLTPQHIEKTTNNSPVYIDKLYGVSLDEAERQAAERRRTAALGRRRAGTR